MTFEDLAGSWAGKGELWLDPLGNEVHECECAAVIDGNTMRYTWSYDGEPQEGVFTVRDGGATWVDSWHQKTGAECETVPDAWGIVAVQHGYSAPGYGDWRWRTTLACRPDGALVFQMTNVTPWGEEGRAVRMTFQRQ